MRALLEAIVHGQGSQHAPQLLDVEFWRALGHEHGLHVDEHSLATRETLACSTGEPSVPLRQQLDERGYLQSCPHQKVADEVGLVCERINSALQHLKAAGYAPAFIYVFDETWAVLEHHWRLLASVLANDDSSGASVSHTVLEPSLGAHALSRPATYGMDDRTDGGGEIQRHTPIGGAFSMPHRDHSSSDCFDEHGAPTLLSLWVPLTAVTPDNGCMFVVPKESDGLFSQPHHPQHLSPHRNVEWIGGAVAMAPVPPGSTLAWHGSLIHWGGRCASFTNAEPRASLTAAIRRKGAKGTALQEQQDDSLPEITLEALPLSLAERVRYACGSVLLYSFWYGLQGGVLPESLVTSWPEIEDST